MINIPVICGSTRRGRKTIRVAKFVHSTLSDRTGVTTPFVDLLELDLPMMKERLRFDEDAPESVRKWSGIVDEADGLVIVSPEYNHGYPGVLKNAIDYLLPEYDRKPVGIVTVSSGPFGGLICLQALRLSVYGLGAFPVPASLAVSKVGDNFSEDGKPTDPAWVGRTEKFLDTMIWFSEAIAAKKRSDLTRDEEE